MSVKVVSQAVLSQTVTQLVINLMSSIGEFVLKPKPRDSGQLLSPSTAQILSFCRGREYSQLA